MVVGATDERYRDVAADRSVCGKSAGKKGAKMAARDGEHKGKGATWGDNI